MEAAMLTLKVHKVGNSLNLRLPRDAASQLRVSEGDVVYLTETADGGYRITPFDPEFERQMELAEEGMKKYRNTLRELAK
jgi:putative addiction module antidote